MASEVPVWLILLPFVAAILFVIGCKFDDVFGGYDNET